MKSATATPPVDQFEVFFDGKCMVCRREIDMIRRLDVSQQIKLTDIAEGSFEPPENGPTRQQLFRAIHARYPGFQQAPDRWITGVEVFREIYSRLKFETMVGISRWPIVDGVLQTGYQAFAYVRYLTALRRLRKLSGTPSSCEDACDPLGSGEVTTVSVK